MRPTGPLLVLTIGQGVAGGITLMVALVMSQGGLPMVRLDVLVLMALVSAGTGGIASFFHMHRLQAARYVLRRLKTSWLSREALTTALYGAVLAILAVWTLFTSYHGSLFLAWAWICVAFAFSAMWVTAMLYATIPAMLSWHTPITVLSFLTVGILSGGALSALVVPLAQPAFHMIVIAMMVWTFATFIIKWMHWEHFDRARLGIRAETGTGLPFAPYRLQDTGTTKPPYRTQTQVWPSLPLAKGRLLRIVTVAFLIVGAGAFLAVGLITGKSFWDVGLAVSAIIGTITERWLFFAESTHSSQVFFLDQPSVPSRVPTRKPIALPIRKNSSHGH